MAIATFDKKTFNVSSNKILTFDKLSYGESLAVEQQEVTGQKPSTYIKGVSLMTIPLTVELKSSLGVDVQAEIDDWLNMLRAQTKNYFFLGNKPVSRNKFLLTRVDVDGKTILNNSKVQSATLSIELQEYVRGGTAV